jgi:hypothetical protein
MAIDTDLFVVVGLMVSALALPSALGSYAEGVFPKIGLSLMGCGVLIAVFGAISSPDGYAFARIPHSFIEILARIVN